MEVYRKQTQKILKRFLEREIAFPECVAALDHALAKLIPKMRAEDLPSIRAVVLANNETVMKEMEKRERDRATRRENYRKSKLK
jgi:hypothetical protein